MPCDELIKKKTEAEREAILADLRQRIAAERDPSRKYRLQEYLDHLQRHCDEMKGDADPPLPPPPNPFKRLQKVSA